jgi:hypothetical protein
MSINKPLKQYDPLWDELVDSPRRLLDKQLGHKLEKDLHEIWNKLWFQIGSGLKIELKEELDNER